MSLMEYLSGVASFKCRYCKKRNYYPWMTRTKVEGRMTTTTAVCSRWDKPQWDIDTNNKEKNK